MPGGTATETINYRRDASGFLIHRFSSSDDEQYTASAEGRLAAHLKDSVTTTFTSDHTGERLSTTTGTRTITDLVDNANPTGYSQVLRRTDTGGQSFTNIIGDDILAQDLGSTLQHLLSDGHGSTRLLYTTSIQQMYDFDAYGDRVEDSPTTPLAQYLYTGEQADLALGDSSNLRARFSIPGADTMAPDVHPGAR